MVSPPPPGGHQYLWLKPRAVGKAANGEAGRLVGNEVMVLLICELNFRCRISVLDNCESSIYTPITLLSGFSRGLKNLVVGEWSYVRSSSLSVRVGVVFSENTIRRDVCRFALPLCAVPSLAPCASG